MQRVVMRAALGDKETGCSTPRENPLRETGHLSLGHWGSDKPFQQKKGDTDHQHPIPCSDTNADLRFLYSNAHTHTTGSGLTGPGSGNPVLIAVIAGTAGGDVPPMSEVWEDLAHKFKVVDNERRTRICARGDANNAPWTVPTHARTDPGYVLMTPAAPQNYSFLWGKPVFCVLATFP